MKSNHRYYTIAILSACILLAAAGYYFVIDMIWVKAASISSYKNEIISVDQKKQFAQIMTESFEDAQKDITLLESFFVKTQGEVEFIEYIEGLARSRGLEIEMDTVSLDSPKNLGAFNMEYLVINFHVKGSWSAVWNFSRIIESLPYSIDINSMALLREGGGEIDKSIPAVWKGIYTIKVLKKK